MLFKMEEWQSPTGKWHCGHVSSFPKGVSLWIQPARMMNMPVDEYLKWVVENFKPNNFFASDDYSFVSWSWNNIKDMRKFKNKINKIAREKNWQV